MHIVNNTNYSLDQSLCELQKEFSFCSKDTNVFIDPASRDAIYYELSSNSLFIDCTKQNSIYYLLHLAQSHGYQKSFRIDLDAAHITELALMVDCSRNNVLKVETVYRLIRYLAYMGYNTLKLYMEDTYIIPSEPYFGYLRNGYSFEDLKKIDNYALYFNIELVPCIQTLAHLDAPARWCVYRPLFDCKDILCVDNPEVYALIDKMLATLSSTFRSRRINIGMDEAYFLGRGKFLDQHGYEARYDIFQRHLKKVLELCDKYHFQPEMWSDMFFSQSQLAYQNSLSTKLPEINVPLNLKLVYWDYEIRDEDYINKILDLHQRITPDIAYAGGAWKWLGFAPNNALSLEALKRYLKCCNQKNIRDVTVTAWGDNGGECSIFSILPTLNYVGNAKYFGSNVEFDTHFKCLTGINFNDFMNVDRVNQVGTNWSPLHRNYMSSTFLYNDPLLGIYDSTVRPNQSQIYKKVTKLLMKNISNSKFGYIFQTLTSLTDLLSYKCDFGLRLRKAYQQKEDSQLVQIYSEIEIIKAKLDIFYQNFSAQWHHESRANGFDVQDLRIGGLKMRLEHTEKLLNQYLSKQIDTIPELEETIKDFYGRNDEWNQPDDLCESSYQKISTVNVNK